LDRQARLFRIALEELLQLGDQGWWPYTPLRLGHVLQVAQIVQEQRDNRRGRI
jgi:hypothetical protein